MPKSTVQSAATNFSFALILTLSLFALWGLGHRLNDTLLPNWANAFTLNQFERTLIDQIYSVGYFLGAIPAALYARRFGYKAGILFGLISIGAGSFALYPALTTQQNLWLVAAVFLTSIGWIFLEVAANPLVACLGNEKSFVLRLNVAQCFYPLGALAGTYYGRILLSHASNLPVERFVQSFVHPFMAIGAGVLLLAYYVDYVKFPAVATQRAVGLGKALRELRALMVRPIFVFGVVAQCFGVIALAATWSRSDLTFATFPQLAPTLGIEAFVFCVTVFAFGRFVGSALMSFIRAEHVLALFCLGGVSCSLLGGYYGGATLGASVIANNVFVSILWPTILGLSIRGLGSDMKVGTALVCMGSALGGFIYLSVMALWKVSPIALGTAASVLSFAVILIFALVFGRARKPVAVAGAVMAH